MRALLAVGSAERSELHAALLHRGWRVTSADSAAEAIDRFRASPCELVVVAARLPDGDGVALCRSIRGARSGGDAYLMVLHPTTVPELVRPLIEAGVDDLVTTPIAPAYLLMRLAMAEYRLESQVGGPQDDGVAPLEQALQAQRASLEEIFQSAPEAIVVVDADARVARVNDEFSRLFGYPAEEALGRSVHDLIVPPQQAEEGRAAMQAALDGRRVVMETVRRDRNGRLIDVSLLATPIRVGDDSIGAYGIYRDISAWKSHERALTESEARFRARSTELELAMQARSRLYTTMNHELRTPISSIMLYQELLLSGMMGRLAPEQTRALSDSHSAARHLLELVNDILDLSKMEAGKIAVNPGPLALADFLAELRASVLPLASRHGSDVRLELSASLPEIVTDPQRLRQILLNLVSNAAKFGEGRPIVLRARLAGEVVVVEVEDHGVGISSEDLAHIFEDFVQVGDGQHGGTGLGLAISRRLAGLLGGRLEVESALEKGSTFRLVLPRLGAVAMDAGQATAAPAIEPAVAG